jgi:hypothetical protein
MSNLRVDVLNEQNQLVTFITPQQFKEKYQTTLPLAQAVELANLKEGYQKYKVNYDIKKIYS